MSSDHIVQELAAPADSSPGASPSSRIDSSPIPTVASEPLIYPTESFHRLHPLSLMFGVLRHGKAFLVPALLVLVLARRSSWELWLMILFVPVSAIEFYRYFTLRYRVGGGQLIIRKGLIFRSERLIPLGRIQNIDVVQNVLQRLFGVAEVRVETAGGAEPEASFKVLALPAIEQLRQRVFAGRPQAPPIVSQDDGKDRDQSNELAHTPAGASSAASDAKHIHAISVGELIRLGLISNRGLALIFIALGIAWEYDLFDRIDFRRLWSLAHDESVAFTWAHAVILGVAAFILLRLLSVGWMILRFFDYRLTREGDDLRLRCGLLTRVTATVPRRRVQLVSVQQTLLQRMMKRASIRIETAGGGGGGSDGERDTHAAVSRRWFVPTIHVDDVPRVLQEIRIDLPAEVSEAPWRALARGARLRMMSRAVRWSLVAVVILAAVFRPWGAASAFIIVPFALWHAHRQARFMSCARIRDGVLFRSGAWTRRISATFLDKVQVISLGESPFDRRWNMATLRVDTAGAGPAEHAIAVPYLPRDEARLLASDLASAAGSVEFRW